MKQTFKKDCDGCKAADNVGTSAIPRILCGLGYNTIGAVPAEPCPKPRNQKDANNQLNRKGR